MLLYSRLPFMAIFSAVIASLDTLILWHCFYYDIIIFIIILLLLSAFVSYTSTPLPKVIYMFYVMRLCKLFHVVSLKVPIPSTSIYPSQPPNRSFRARSFSLSHRTVSLTDFGCGSASRRSFRQKRRLFGVQAKPLRGGAAKPWEVDEKWGIGIPTYLCYTWWGSGVDRCQLLNGF